MAEPEPIEGAPSGRIETLRAVPLFEDLTDEELRLLAARCSERRAGRHETIFEEGAAGDGLYVIESGAVSIVRGRVGQPLQRLARLGPGGYFGEMELLGGGARSATAIASEATVLVHVRTQELLRLFRERPLLAIKLRTAVIRRHGENVASTLQSSGRRELRTRLDADVELTDADGSETKCRLENLSAGGASLRRPPAGWQVGRSVAFTLRSPGGETLLKVEGRVAWRNATGAGIAFTSVAGAEGGERRGAAAAAAVRQAIRCLLEESD